MHTMLTGKRFNNQNHVESFYRLFGCTHLKWIDMPSTSSLQILYFNTLAESPNNIRTMSRATENARKALMPYHSISYIPSAKERDKTGRNAKKKITKTKRNREYRDKENEHSNNISASAQLILGVTCGIRAQKATIK